MRQNLNKINLQRGNCLLFFSECKLTHFGTHELFGHIGFHGVHPSRRHPISAARSASRSLASPASGRTAISAPDAGSGASALSGSSTRSSGSYVRSSGLLYWQYSSSFFRQFGSRLFLKRNGITLYYILSFIYDPG